MCCPKSNFLAKEMCKNAKKDWQFYPENELQRSMVLGRLAWRPLAVLSMLEGQLVVGLLYDARG